LTAGAIHKLLTKQKRAKIVPLKNGVEKSGTKNGKKRNKING